jgi:DNA-binding transcriptional MerR regulator
MPPRPGIEPEDIVTPSQAARLLGVPASTVRTWIERYGVESLGKIGRWNVYDFREIAAIEAVRATALSSPAAFPAAA